MLGRKQIVVITMTLVRSFMLLQWHSSGNCARRPKTAISRAATKSAIAGSCWRSQASARFHIGGPHQVESPLKIGADSCCLGGAASAFVSSSAARFCAAEVSSSRLCHCGGSVMSHPVGQI